MVKKQLPIVQMQQRIVTFQKRMGRIQKPIVNKQ